MLAQRVFTRKPFSSAVTLGGGGMADSGKPKNEAAVLKQLKSIKVTLWILDQMSALEKLEVIERELKSRKAPTDRGD